MPEPVKPDNAPPATVTSAAANVLDDFDSVNVSVAVSPDLSADLLLMIVIDGACVSIDIAVARLPAVLPLPVASVNFPAATLTVPEPLKFAVGVNFAV